MELALAALGVLAVCIVDVWWWHIDHKKAEKGMEAHEHYHVGLELVIVSLIVQQFYAPAAWFAAAAGITFIVAEWRQVHEIKNGKVVPGHPFAYGSTHFKQSTMIGVALLAVIVSLFFLV